MKIELILNRWRLRYHQYAADYQAYAKMRGFKSFNDQSYHIRGFIKCWAEPGFHRFWQIWNPGIAYFVYRAYLKLGGRSRPLLATLGAFLINGLVHTLFTVPFTGKWSWMMVTTFACFGILTILSRLIADIIKQESWFMIFNLMVNIGLVLVSFHLGFKVDKILH